MLRHNSKHEITFLCGDEMFESWRTGLFNGYSKNIDFSFLRQGKSNRISHPAMLNRDARLSVALLTLSNILQGTTAKPGFLDVSREDSLRRFRDGYVVFARNKQTGGNHG